MENSTAVMTPDFLQRMQQFKKDWHKFYADIGAQQTPQYDGAGNEIIRRRPDGKDYIVDAWMRKKLDEVFPGWSWVGKDVIFLGSEWVAVSGHLEIIDEHLLALGIMPPVRRYFGCDAARIAYGRDKPHTPENIVDVGDNLKSANTSALKKAINALCFIGDDVYGKRIDEEGSGSLDELIHTGDAPTQKKMLDRYIADKHILVSQVFKTLGVTSWSEVSDYQAAYEKLKAAYK